MASVPAGIPQNLEDHVDDYIDLNEYFIRDPEETFMVTATGESMTGAHIKSGDTLIVDRAIEPTHGHIVIAVVDGNLTVKRLQKTSGDIVLKPENKAYEPIAVTKKNGLHIWGVVTHMTPTFTRKKDNLYRYYVSTQAVKKGYSECPLKTIKTINLKRIVLITDNDTGGDRLTDKIQNAIAESGFSGEITRHSPDTRGGDWNDVLTTDQPNP